MVFIEERNSGTSKREPVFSLCCAAGKVTLPPFQNPPAVLHRLFTSMDQDAKEFRKNIRSYNNCFSFTSNGAKVDQRFAGGGGPYTYRICGELHHRIGSLLPAPGVQPVFAQLYISDPQAELANR